MNSIIVKISAVALVALLVGGIVGWYAGQVLAPSKVEVKPILSGDIPIGVLHASPLYTAIEAPMITLAFADLNQLVNASGQPVKFVPLIENAQESPTQAVEAAQTLITQGAQVITGLQWTSIARPILPLANQRQIVLISASSSAPSLAIPNDYLFRVIVDDNVAATTVNAITLSKGIKAVVAVYSNDAYGQGFYGAISGQWTASGVKILGSLPVDPSKTEYTSEFSSVESMYTAGLKTYPADQVGIYLLASYNIIIPMLNSLGRYPDLLKARVFDTDCGDVPAVVQQAGQVAAAVNFTTMFFAPPSSAKVDDITQRYTAIAGYRPSDETFLLYDAIMLAGLSILAAGQNSGLAIKNVLPIVAASYYGATGLTTLNAAGDRAFGNYKLYTVVNQSKPSWELIGFYDGISGSIKWLSPTA